MKKEIKNISASVKARLLQYAKKENVAFNRILLYYFHERFLYRVSLSEYKNTLILKGGVLLLALDINKGRPTKDIDFLAKLETLDHSTAVKMIQKIATVAVDDGVVFYSNSVKCSNIREEGDMNALRVHFDATLGSARGAMQVDIGYKDSAFPAPIAFEYPTLLDFPAPHLKAYCWETVIAEKFEAMIKLHTLNSRLKDFYDIAYLATKQNFNGHRLHEAIAGTFKKRDMIIETVPVIFTEKFMQDETKRVQWQAFLRKTNIKADDNFATIVAQIHTFLGPVVEAISNGKGFKKRWDSQKLEWA
ncbi:MAG: nucleotidyl transferase AbiEii/AbiGii toxin family protein [Deltaproteobacteria bacterium]|nr:nucleotidyl transferase AbiEii/AbiGii toxin family protein [Deltaproteobacteria bacterium]